MQILRAYDLFMAEKSSSCAAKTIIFYTENLERFFGFMQVTLDKQLIFLECSEINRELLLKYILKLRQPDPDGRALKNTSINTYFRAVRTFVNWCEDENFIQDDPLRKIKLPRADDDVIVPITQQEADRLDSILSDQSFLDIRNKAIIHLMLDAGLRSCEVVRLRMQDLDFQRNIIRIHGKGSKQRIVRMCPKVKQMLLAYLECIGEAAQHDPVFWEYRNGSGVGISSNCLKQLFADLKVASGIDRLHAHLLRHTFATSYMMGGGNLEYLRLLMGHYDYTVTRRYLHLSAQYQMLDVDVYHLDPIFFKSAY